MKEQWSISNEKLVSVEEGHGNSIPDKKGFTYLKPVNTHHMCEQIIQCVKLILYLELLLFVGWASYTIWQSYHIDSMEAKVIDNIREAESKNLFDQQSTFDKSTVAPEELHTSEDKVVLINPIGYVGDSHHDTKQPLNEEHDVIPLAKPDRDSPTKDSELSSVLNVDSAKNVEINESDKDTTVYNCSEIQDHFITEEPKQVENGKEANSEYYALLSLLLQNAMKTEPMKDHTTDSSINLQDAPVLSGSIYTSIDGLENLETQEDQEKENQENWEYLGNQENWYQENMESQANQENQEFLENLGTQGNLENQENWENEENDEIQESEVHQENQEYQEIQENMGILENQENQENLENLDVLGNQENQQSASAIQESPEILENVETPILIMDDDYFEKNWKNDMLSMLRTSKDPNFADKPDDHVERIGDMLRIDYDDGLDDLDYRLVPYLRLNPSSDLVKTDIDGWPLSEYPYDNYKPDPYLFL